ncbi:hypothetical protein [Clostridium butyricum]|uniref:hypothetical protein n=1 Tax=Clostridium butyricum TaxID=1492 RepID=UPI0005C15F25|nr:hypothetical protein [Clostridium butyricum]KIU08843.1 hypothetical protein SC08_Contig83orf02877 [Clostridium butyricum]MBA8965109.1 hypothetical protein [Clostridium butyricum]MBA8965173.1 hypothetical protein [Clostridium butyricum]MBA8970270.1 hypothetical protein [Clostridium butyricum]MBC2428197.1 hypothetical protein [Clostridium butyricum]
MTKNEYELEVLNSLEVIEASGSCGEIEYILIENNTANIDALKKIGITEHEIEEECNCEDNLLDISPIIGQFATNYNSRKKKFYNLRCGY